MASGEEVDRRFRRNATLLWAAQFISATGDAVFMPCLAWVAGRTGSSDASVGLAVFLATLPYLVFGPLAGAWVDRANRRRVMVVSDLLRAALLLGLPAAAAALGGMTFGLIVGTGVLLSTFSTPFLPARDALLPSLIGDRSLARWNAVMQTSGQLAMIVGLCLGGVLLAGTDADADEVLRVEFVLQLDGATFLVSAVLLCLIRLPRQGQRTRPTTRLLQDAREGLRYALRDPVVGGLLLLTALNNLAIMGPAIVGAALLVQDVFRLEVAHYAWFEASMAVGMVAGSTVMVVKGRRWRMGTVVLWGMVLDGLTYLPFLWLPDYEMSLVAIGLHGLFIPLIVVGRTSLLQRYVPPERHGKVFALVNITVIGMTAISAALSGWIAEVTGPRTLFGLAGAFGALSGLAGFIWLRRRFDALGS